MEESNLTAPGNILRKARLAKGLSEADIASRLRLSLHLVKALEADEYAGFAAPVYVRGYLRSYAALLDLDSESVLAAFDRSDLESSITQERPAQYAASTITNIGYLHQSKYHIARWMGWIIAVFLVLLLGAWWYGQHHRKHVDMSAGVLIVAKPTVPPVVAATPTPASAVVSASTPTPAPAVVSAPVPASTATAVTPVAKPKAAATPAPAGGLHETFILIPKKS